MTLGLWNDFSRLVRRALPIGIFACAFSFSAAQERPNIIFILADDIGYGDLGCYGAKLVKTPNLDKLAADGCRFTDAHSPASTCTPTRRAFLTGTYSFRQQPGSAIAPGDAPLSIKPGTQTLPSLLQRAGYVTAVVGKWHLGLGAPPKAEFNGEIKPGPIEIGFDYAFIMPATGDRVPCVYVEDHRVVGLDSKDPIQVNYQVKTGSEPTGAENPELLKLKPTHGHDNTIVNGVSRIGWMSGGRSAHWVDEDMSDTFTRKASAFIEKNQANPFFLYFATHTIHVPRVPHPRFKGSSQCGTRGDAIQELDAGVGELMKTLERLNLTDKTMVIFSSDNGGVMDDGYEDVGSLEHSCNGSLRGYKGSLFEGGHRVPFLVRWPGRIKPGRVSDEMIGLIDMPATLAALTGVNLDPDAALDSYNILPAFLGNSQTKKLREHLVFQIGRTNGPLAIRQGDWKLVQPGGAYARQGNTASTPTGGARTPELFNLADDPAETKNLARERPEKALELTALLARIRTAGRSR